MTPVFLLEALADSVAETVKNFRLESKEGAGAEVKVFKGYLPMPKQRKVTPRGAAREEDNVFTEKDMLNVFPCVIVRILHWEDVTDDSASVSRATVRMLVGAYDNSSDCQGYIDVMNVLERLRQTFWARSTLKDKTGAPRFRMELTSESFLYEEQPYPVFFGAMDTTWTIGRPQLNFEEE